jgi:hypothetical protein
MLLTQEKEKDVYVASMELDGWQQLLDVSLVAADHELHPLTGLSDGTHHEP